MNEKDFDLTEEIDSLRALIRQYGSIEELFSPTDSTFSKKLKSILAKTPEDSLSEAIQELTDTFKNARRDRTLPTPYVRSLGDVQTFFEKLGQSLPALEKIEGLKILKEATQELDKILTNAGKGIKELSKAMRQMIVDVIDSQIDLSKASLVELSKIQYFKDISEKAPIQGYYYQGNIDDELLSRYYSPNITTKTNLGAFQEFKSVFLSARDARKQLPLVERLLGGERSSFLESVDKEFTQEAIKSLNIAKEKLKQQLADVNKKIEETENPEEKAKLLEERFQYIKSLTNVYREELSIRSEINKELRGLVSSLKDFALRELNYILSSTRNPFVDIFTSSLKTGFLVGTATYRATTGLLDNFRLPNITPSGRTPPPTIPPEKPTGKQTSPIPPIPDKSKTPFPTTPPESTSGETRTSPLGTLRESAKSFGKGAALTSLAALGLDFGIQLIEGKDPKEAAKETFSLRNLLITGASSAVGTALSFTPIPGLNLLLGLLGGTATYSLLNSLFPDQPKQEANNKSTEESTQQLNQALSLLSSNAFKASESLSLLGVGAVGAAVGLKSLPIGSIVKELAGVTLGTVAGALAFTTDFYLQSVNKAYDTYYSRFVQTRLLPQNFREQLGTNVAEISRQFAPGGRVFPAGMGFTPEEYLATSARLFASLAGLTTNIKNFDSALLNSARVANLFGTSISDAVNLITTSRRALIDERQAMRGAFILGGEFSAFTKAFSEAIISASTSLAIRQGLNPNSYFQSFLTTQTLFTQFSSQTISELAKRNPEIVQQAVNSINEFIRSGLAGNPVALGVSLRAGLTPLEIQKGATPENIIAVLQRLAIDTGLTSQFVGGKFTPQAQNFLIPIIQQLLGFSNISPEVFRSLLSSAITGDIRRANTLVERELLKPIPNVRTPDDLFAKQLDVLNTSMQLLVETFKENTASIVNLNKNITTLAAVILAAGEPLGKASFGIIDSAINALSGVGAINIDKPEIKRMLEFMSKNATLPANSPKVAANTTPEVTTSNTISPNISSISQNLPRGTYVIVVNGDISNVPLQEFIENMQKKNR